MCTYSIHIRAHRHIHINTYIQLGILQVLRYPRVTGPYVEINIQIRIRIHIRHTYAVTWSYVYMNSNTAHKDSHPNCMYSWRIVMVKEALSPTTAYFHTKFHTHQRFMSWLPSKNKPHHRELKQGFVRLREESCWSFKNAAAASASRIYTLLLVTGSGLSSCWNPWDPQLGACN